MAHFEYKAQNKKGKAVEGIIEAADMKAAQAALRTQGLNPRTLVPTRAKDDVMTYLGPLLGLESVGVEELVMFCRQMYTLTKAGVPIIKTINGLAENTRNPTLARALIEVAQDLEGGRDLSQAFAKHNRVFSNLFISVVQVGESTGNLEEAFVQLGGYLELERETKKRIKSAMRYPTMVLGAIGAAMVIINIFVIPAFAQVFSSFGAELPLFTRILLGVSEFSVQYWPHLLAGMAAMYFGFEYWKKTDAGALKWDYLKLRMPIVGSITERATLSRFSRSFAMCLTAGVPMLSSLSVVSRAVANRFMEQQIGLMRSSIERGESLTSSAVASKMFTPLVLQMISVGETTGAIDDLLCEVAEYYEREVDYDLKQLTDAIEPILIVIIGGMVLVLALGVYLPMWDLSKAAKGG